jgi:hypothetical protein
VRARSVGPRRTYEERPGTRPRVRVRDQELEVRRVLVTGNRRQPLGIAEPPAVFSGDEDFNVSSRCGPGVVQHDAVVVDSLRLTPAVFLPAGQFSTVRAFAVLRLQTNLATQQIELFIPPLVLASSSVAFVFAGFALLVDPGSASPPDEDREKQGNECDPIRCVQRLRLRRLFLALLFDQGPERLQLLGRPILVLLLLLRRKALEQLEGGRHLGLLLFVA